MAGYEDNLAQYNIRTGRSLNDCSAGQMAAAQNQYAPTPTQSPLSSVIDGLRRKIGSLEALHDGLLQKLAPVLVSIPESNEKVSGGGIAGPQSAVVMELSEIEYRLGVLCRKLDVLTTRIEA